MPSFKLVATHTETDNAVIQFDFQAEKLSDVLFNIRLFLQGNGYVLDDFDDYLEEKEETESGCIGCCGHCDHNDVNQTELSEVLHELIQQINNKR